MGNVNRKATKQEMEHATEVIREAFPDCEPVFGGHSAYGGRRAPRDHTISFRLRDQLGQFRSNVVWMAPEYLSLLTVEAVRYLVASSNGAASRKKRKRR